MQPVVRSKLTVSTIFRRGSRSIASLTFDRPALLLADSMPATPPLRLSIRVMQHAVTVYETGSMPVAAATLI